MNNDIERRKRINNQDNSITEGYTLFTKLNQLYLLLKLY